MKIYRKRNKIFKIKIFVNPKFDTARPPVNKVSILFIKNSKE
jgi:hypothetical protein